tara:strand:- start:63 stop:299 length:237 start_codon:yes stop_codon:yes gene_type:complete
MYINGKKISLEQLETFTNNLITGLIDDLYKSVISDGVDSIFPNDTYNQQKLIKKMLEYYIEHEEYEKCAKLHKLQVIN